MGLIIDPVAILLGAAGGLNRTVLFFNPVEETGERMAVQEEGTSTAPNPRRVIRSREDSALGFHLHLTTPYRPATCVEVTADSEECCARTSANDWDGSGNRFGLTSCS